MTEVPTDNSVASLNDLYLCCGCGTCVGVCPQGAITVRPQPGGFAVSVDDSCVNCGLCLAVCPGVGFATDPPDQTTDSVRRSKWPPSIDDLIGPHIGTYLGHACNQRIRTIGTSGGICTQLLIFCLQQGWIDAAIVTRMDLDTLRGTAVVAESPEEVIGAAKSKYCPTSPNVALRDVRLHSNRKYALVGLPCHLAGLAKAQSQLPTLGNVVLRVGLFCSHSVTQEGLPFLLARYARGVDGLEEVGFREKGWPGCLLCRYEDGQTFTISLDRYWRSFYGSYFFTPFRCLTCSDLAAEQADLSLADAWLPEVRERDDVGTSMLVTRSLEAEELVWAMENAGLVQLSSISPKKVVEAQFGILQRKKTGVAGRTALLNACNKPVPRSTGLGTRRQVDLGAILVFFNAWISTTRIGRWLLSHLPERWLTRYQSLVYRLSGGEGINLDEL